MQPAPAQPADPAAIRNRSRMLAKVRTFWIDGVLEQSLHGAVLLELGMVAAPQAVERAWDAVVQQPDCPARTLPLDTPISEVYDDLDQALLILGAPGSGKTTLLLELARDLLDHAEQDDTDPIPVVFNLSTWHTRHGTLAAWLVDELHTRYHVPRNVARDWIAHDQITPLLDGLDETAPTERESCVAAINHYRRDHGMPGMAVCSRVGDYDLLQSRLQLQGAVMLQPLSDEQIARYLDGAGEHLAAVRVALRQDRALRELAETPLLLSIMSLAYQGTSLAELDHPETLQQRRHHLFETYIQRMFTRRAPVTRYAPEQLRGWLHWLAQQMHTRAQSVFFLEDLQPDCLDSNRQRWQFATGVGASVGLLGGWTILFMVGLSLLTLLLANQITPPQPGQFAFWLLLLLPVVGLAGYVLLRTPRWATRISPVLGTGSVLFALVGTPLLLLWNVQEHGNLRTWLLLLPPVVGIIFGSSVGMTGAALRSLNSHTGHLHLPAIRPVERLHWSWEQAQHALAAGVLLGQGVGVLAFLLLEMDWFSFTTTPVILVLRALIAALTGGAVVGLLLGLLGGLTGGEVELRTVPNQGIHQSAGHALRMLLLAPLLTLIIGMLAGVGQFLLLFLASPASALGILHGQTGGGRFVPWLPIVITLLGLPLVGVLLALASGGTTCLQHGVLRLLLTRSGAMPWRYVPMLDYAAERLLLRKVGGGYIFMHRLLLEHITTTPPAGVTPAHQPTSAGQQTIRLPAASVDAQRGIRPAQPRGYARTLVTRLAATAAYLLPGGQAAQHALLRGSIGLTLAMLLAGGVLAGMRYVPSPQQQQMLTTSTRINDLALTTDGDLLADAIGGWDAQVHIRDGTTGSLLRTLELQNRHAFVGSLVFAPDGNTLAIGLIDSRTNKDQEHHHVTGYADHVLWSTRSQFSYASFRNAGAS